MRDEFLLEYTEVFPYTFIDVSGVVRVDETGYRRCTLPLTAYLSLFTSAGLSIKARPFTAQIRESSSQDFTKRVCNKDPSTPPPPQGQVSLKIEMAFPSCNSVKSTNLPYKAATPTQ